MRVLYGVQGTGNGHLSRARAMATAFDDRGIHVDYLFTGRDRDRYFDMQCFGNFEVRRGLSFVTVNGRVDYWQTFRRNGYGQFLRDVCGLELRDHDLVITDFEPVSAWAGLLRGKPVISMGHQPAFDHRVPVADRDFLSALVMRLFAPGRTRVGMHWDKFDAPILPPLIDVHDGLEEAKANKVLVYLPFESQERVRDILAGITGYNFYIYASGSTHSSRGNLHLRPTSLEGFRADLRDSSAVLCNAGFELASECLALGKRMLVKPVEKQMEQASNALALQRLGYAAALRALDREHIKAWLGQRTRAARMEGPDIARAIVGWIEAGDYGPQSLESLSDRLWRSVRVNTMPVWPKSQAEARAESL